MCTLMKTSEMPEMKNGNIVKGGNKKFISLFLKPNAEGENYRVRLLWYMQSSKNDRKTPYFSQMIHDHWGETQNGTKIVDDVIICPGTKYAHYDEEKFLVNEKTGQKYLNCPICMKSAENFAIAKNSAWKDKIATKRGFALKSKFRGIVPVYVVHDPNTKKVDERTGETKYINDHTMKALIFTNKEEFERFDTLVQEEKSKAYLASKEGNGYEIFNGENAVDLYIHMDQVDEVVNQGKPNEYVKKVRKITGMKFGAKAYNIPTITEETINAFEMDDQYYVSNTKEELQEFYDKYYGHDEIKAPEEEVDIFAESPKVEKKEIATENTNVKKEEKPTVDESEIEELTKDPDDIPFDDKEEKVPETKDEHISNSEIDDILAGM